MNGRVGWYGTVTLLVAVLGTVAGWLAVQGSGPPFGGKPVVEPKPASSPNSRGTRLLILRRYHASS